MFVYISNPNNECYSETLSAGAASAPAHLNEDRKLLQVERRIDGLRQQGRHDTGRHNIHGQSVSFIAQHDPVDV